MSQEKIYQVRCDSTMQWWEVPQSDQENMVNNFGYQARVLFTEPVQAQPVADAAPQQLTVSRAGYDVWAERERQISVEGWTAEYDDNYAVGTLAQAAACYALHTEPVGNIGDYLRFWPFSSAWWKPTSRRRNLVKAGALILAEIEKYDRALAAKPAEGDKP